MAEKIINGFSVVAYATQPEGRVPPRAFLETRLLPKKKTEAELKAEAEARAKAQAAGAEQAGETQGETQDGGQDGGQDPQPESQAFEIFVSRRFRSTVEAMSAARNALDRVKKVDAEGVPDHLPE